MFDLAVACLVVTAVLAYINHRFVKLPTTIGVMAIALAFSLALVAIGQAGWGLEEETSQAVLMLKSIDFSDVLMHGMLSLLLFAAALHVDLSTLKDYKWPVGLLAIVGTTVSTVVVGYATHWLLSAFGIQLSLMYCLVFGALISPTDPIAVMGILRSAGAPQSLRMVISGESLFNDGWAVVVFVMLAGVAASGKPLDMSDGLHLLLTEVGGGVALGLFLGGIMFYMLRTIDNYIVEVLITLAAVLGGYRFATAMHFSGPLAMVIAGMFIGNHGRDLAMSDTTRHHIDMFWELLDEMLNAVLFVLLGLEIVLISFESNLVLAGLAAIVVTLLARLFAVGLPVKLLNHKFKLPNGAWKVLTWGGLRGGISVALALSLPPGDARDVILTLTYCVVVFSILVQGLSIGGVIKKTMRSS